MSQTRSVFWQNARIPVLICILRTQKLDSYQGSRRGTMRRLKLKNTKACLFALEHMGIHG